MHSDDRQSEIEAARALVRRDTRVVVLTGAGISTDSGIPDFRGPQGLWTKNPAAEKLATLQHYLAEPEVRRNAWRTRLESPMWRAEPNAGHRAFVGLQQRGTLHTLVTQNVDGLHQKAGVDPDLVVEIHGTVHAAQCWSCRTRFDMDPFLERVAAGEPDPDCPVCGGIVKSATISFGQSLVPEDLERAMAAAAVCDLLLAVGTSLAVYPVAGMVPTAVRSGAPVVIVNAEPTELDHLADVVLRGQIADVLPAMLG